MARKLKTCAKGHQFYKSSDCPTCPVCEAERKPSSGFLTLLSAPARRALEKEKLTSLEALAQWTEEDLLQLHGIGPSSIPKLRESLAAEGLHFKKHILNREKA